MQESMMTRLPQADADHDVPTDRRWALGEIPWLSGSERTTRARVIVDNDFIGDPDDLFHLVHHVLSPSVHIPLIVSSHLHEGEVWDPSERQAGHGALVVRDVLARMGVVGDDVVVVGAESALAERLTPIDTPAARAIIAEALREDPRPLYYCAGGGLTDLASAYLLEPAIAERLTLVWIGGSEHKGLGIVAPGVRPAEYNLTIDTVAAQVVFGDSAIPIWQVPRSTYRQATVSMAELRVGVRPFGPVGAYLYDEICAVGEMLTQLGMNAGETYVMGDQPLVLLTALQTAFEPDPASSDYATLPTPRVGADGLYVARDDGRPMRVYTWVDNRLTFDDLRAKLAELATWQEGRSAS
jgi:hypothetical protein